MLGWGGVGVGRLGTRTRNLPYEDAVKEMIRPRYGVAAADDRSLRTT